MEPEEVTTAVHDTLWTPIPQLSTRDDMPLDSATIAMTTTIADRWTIGKEGEPRPVEQQPDSWLLAFFVIIMTLIATGAHNLRHIFGSLDTDLLGVRRRANAFDSHTASESRTLLLLVFLACSCETVLLGIFLKPTAISNTPLLAALLGLTVVFYLFQVIAYSILGYTFTDKVNTAQLLKGLNLSQGLMGLLLLVPTLIVIFYSNVVFHMLILAAIIYILGRITLICKGFRIFYNGLSSLVYFILYLCALEIIPVILVGSVAKYLSLLL